MEVFPLHKVLPRLKAVKERAQTNGWSQELEDKYNDLHALMHELREKAARKTRKIRKGAIPWSPKLQSFRTSIEIWESLLKKRKGKSVSNRKIRRLLKKTDITDAYVIPVEEIERRLTQAHAAYREAKKQAPMWRDDFLHELAKARALRKGTTEEKELELMKRIERQRQEARNIKRMRRKLDRCATNQVYYERHGVRTLATSKRDIEKACIEENISRFSQSEGTPPLEEPMLSLLGIRSMRHKT